MTEVAIVVQARTGSTRLPGKVLMPCAGATILERMVERVCAAKTASHVIVATTTNPADDAIAEVVRDTHAMLVRGDEHDLLDRHVQAARLVNADVVVKIPSDCPLIDPATIDRVIGDFLADPIDYVSNLHPATWPDGFDVEVMDRRALELAWTCATRPLEREHTTPFLWDNPERFRTRNVAWETGLDYSRRYRLTLDHREDYEVIRGVFDALWSPHALFTLAEILDLLAATPELAATNARLLGASWMTAHASELKTLAKEIRPQ